MLTAVTSTIFSCIRVSHAAISLRKHFPVVSSKLIGILTATFTPSVLRRAEKTQAMPPRPT